MAVYSQDNRRARLITPLGKDVLLLRSFHGQEGLSQLFHFELEMFSENRSLSFASLVGKNATIHIQLENGSAGYLNGFFRSFTQGATEYVESGSGGIWLTQYAATLVPWPWFLTCTRNCRIFQNKTTIEILQAIFTDRQFADYDLRLSGNYLPREYCVQYRETDFHFLSRLMEEEGIFYFFEHEEKKHTLVLADHPSEFKPSPVWPDMYFRPMEGALERAETIRDWSLCQQVRPGQYTLCDFNFETPLVRLSSGVPGKDERGYEIYDYPGEFADRDQGDQLVGIRMQEEESFLLTIQGEGNCLGMLPGYRFELKEHYRKDFNKPYVLVSIHHAFDQSAGYRSSSSDVIPEYEYANRFQCIPYPTPFRPPRCTQVPVVHGSQTALVVGPPGEEILVDKYGRVKVQFHWDRQGQYDDKSSCWIRVAQGWAGKGWGMITIPRIGQEVIVDFLEGNPDQPIITGRVYNGESMPPYDLPDYKTVSAMKSYSSKGGDGFNEIRFEDKKGEEQLFLHAEKDFDLRVKNDRRENIGNDRYLMVKRDKKEQVERDSECTVKRDFIGLVERDFHFAVKEKATAEIKGSLSLSVKGDVAEEFKSNHSSQVGGCLYLKGMNVVVEGSTGLTIKCGGNFVSVNPAGVQIQGSMVLINSGGAALTGVAGALVPVMSPNKVVEADTAKPGAQPELPKVPTHDPNSEENQKKKNWIEIAMVDEAGNPIPGEQVRVLLPDGSETSGTLNEKGILRIEGIDPGSCQICFTELDEEAWEPA